jgi:hypothetical protein
MMKLSLIWQQGIQVTCSLNYYGVVNHTSPGFAVLFKCRHGLIGLQEARMELRWLRERGLVSFKEMDPCGQGWVEASLLFECSCLLQSLFLRDDTFFSW